MPLLTRQKQLSSSGYSLNMNGIVLTEEVGGHYLLHTKSLVAVPIATNEKF